MIPKVIHYCWFGGNPLPESAKKCIASWKKHCPDYEIKCWDESNFDVQSCAYVREAYEAKKWAFVSDYARIKIVYENGGIYMDTDVELIKPLDALLQNKAYFGFQNEEWINTGLGFGGEKGLPLLGDVMRDYEAVHFRQSDGTFDQTTCPARNTQVFLPHGLRQNGEKQILDDGVLILPVDYLSPKDWFTGEMKKTENTVSIHHFDGSWGSEEDNLFMLLQQRLRRVLPDKTAIRVALLFSRIKYHGIKAALKR